MDHLHMQQRNAWHCAAAFPTISFGKTFLFDFLCLLL